MTNDKIIERVRKLMALATSSNEHEAAAAAAKAQELLLKYNLSMASIDEEEPDEGVTKEDYFERDPSSWRLQLIGGIARATSCRLIQTPGYRKWVTGEVLPRKGTMYHVFGQPSNIEVVYYLYNYLARELLRLSPKGKGTTAAGHAFRLGAVSVINRRLMETYREFQTASEETRALVHVTTAAVDAKVEETFPKLQKSRMGSLSDAAAYHAGQAAGREIPLRRGVHDSRNAAGQHLLK